MHVELGKQYKELLNQYILNQREEELYAGQNFSRKLIEEKISPEDVISIHKLALKEVLESMPDELVHSFDFLIEMMIHYGLALKENQSLVRKQEEIQLEMNVAIKVQETLLKTKIPKIQGLDIGALSVPAKEMNGDYIYFVYDYDKCACVAVADVIGKGIPAALCMSMIKFAMDSIKSNKTRPREVLDMVNRIVEKSVDDSMFISMFYGKYDAKESVFYYASAGHEPALLYKAKSQTFIELGAKGLLLGVQPNVVYEERSIELEENDFIVILTDGVTETRTTQGFIEEDFIKNLLVEVKDESAQTMVDEVYGKLGQMQDFVLRDDFTIVIFKKDNSKV
ncbi:SpoIIE family protein phosphatase [Sporosarcina sp. CAU 1771]